MGALVASVLAYRGHLGPPHAHTHTQHTHTHTHAHVPTRRHTHTNTHTAHTDAHTNARARQAHTDTSVAILAQARSVHSLAHAASRHGDTLLLEMSDSVERGDTILLEISDSPPDCPIFGDTLLEISDNDAAPSPLPRPREEKPSPGKAARPRKRVQIPGPKQRTDEQHCLLTSKMREAKERKAKHAARAKVATAARVWRARKQPLRKVGGTVRVTAKRTEAAIGNLLNPKKRVRSTDAMYEDDVVIAADYGRFVRGQDVATSNEISRHCVRKSQVVVALSGLERQLCLLEQWRSFSTLGGMLKWGSGVLGGAGVS